MKPVDHLFPSVEASHRHLILDETGSMLTLGGTCPITKKDWRISVRKSGYVAWVSGALIQKALPELTPDERELLLSGTTAEGWNLMCDENAD